MKILLADDDPMTLLLVGGLLGDWGFEVVSCSDGASALAALTAADAPPLAILDWQMQRSTAWRSAGA